MAPTQRDGAMRTDENHGYVPNYYPNSFMNVKDSDNFLDSNFTVPQTVVYRYDDKDEHNYEQPRDLYNSFSSDWKERLHRSVAMALTGAMDFIVDRQLDELRKVDPSYAEGVRLEMNRLRKKSEILV